MSVEPLFDRSMLSCAINVSEGRDRKVLRTLAKSCRDVLLDLHLDKDHHRSVFTLGGTWSRVFGGARKLAASAKELLSLENHIGSHQRLGVLDVVPFVPLVELKDPGPDPSHLSKPSRSQVLCFQPDPDLGDAVLARDAFATWAAFTLGLACYLYGPRPGHVDLTLPELRRSAKAGVSPDLHGPMPTKKAGTCAVGARGFLVAYNIWLEPGPHGKSARIVADQLRSPHVRTLAFELSGHWQVSCNLVAPHLFGPRQVADHAALLLDERGLSVERYELVGLVPRLVLDAVTKDHRERLGISEQSTLEHKISQDVESRQVLIQSTLD